MFTLAALLALVPLTSPKADVINRVYAIVGDKVITQYDLESLNPQKLKMIYDKYKGEERAEQLKSFYNENLETMIDNDVVEIAAAQEGVTVSDKEVDGAIDDIMQRNNVDRVKLDTLLAAQHTTYEQYRMRIKTDILTTRLMSIVFRPKVVVNDDDVKKYIDENQTSLDLSDQYELRVMKVSTKAKLDEAMQDFAKNKNFHDTAAKYSEDKNADSGGYLGWVEMALLDTTVRNTIGTIKQGITQPIKDSDGYRVFYVEGYKSKSDVDADKKETIIRAIRTKKTEEIFNNWLADQKANILIQRKYAY